MARQAKTTAFGCSLCGKSKPRTSKKPPSGWKRCGECYTCDRCWRDAYQLRAVALPVLGVIDGGSREGFLAAVDDAFRLSTDLWSWSTRTLLCSDVLRTPGMSGGLPPLAMTATQLYQRYNADGCPCGDMAGINRTSLFGMARAHYEQHRHRALWLGQESLPLHRFPAPYPVHTQGWRQALHEERPALSLRLHGEGSGPRWLLRLASGAPFARQIAGFRQLLALGGDRADCPHRCQLDLYAQPCSQNARGVTVTFRKTSGGQRVPCVLMAKLVCWLPRRTKSEATGCMYLATHPDGFLRAQVEGRDERPWWLYGDQVLQSIRMMEHWHKDHSDWLQRVGDDRKHEKRWPIRQRRQFADAYARRCMKHYRRVKTWIDQMAAQVAGFARRRGVGRVLYCDDNRAFAARFPWHRVRTTLKARLERDGVAYEYAPGREGGGAESPGSPAA